MRLIAETDNAAVAELAKIQLRVVRFISRTNEARHVEDRPSGDEKDVEPITLHLPVTRGPSPTAHLVDVAAKASTLEKLRDLNAQRYQAPVVAPDTFVPLMPVRWMARLIFLLALIVVIGVGPKALFAMFTHKTGEALALGGSWLVFGLCIGLIAVLRVTPTRAEARYLVSPIGLSLGASVVRWELIREVRVSGSDESQSLEAVLHDGTKIATRFVDEHAYRATLASSIARSIGVVRPDMPVFIDGEPHGSKSTLRKEAHP
jgi:hypothetical protein